MDHEPASLRLPANMTADQKIEAIRNVLLCRTSLPSTLTSIAAIVFAED